MKTIGKPRGFFQILILILLAITSSVTVAEVTAILDRDQVALGDTLRLTITATDGEELDEINLSPLNKDFEVLGRSSSSNTSIVNGRLSQSRELNLDLTPRREGHLKIPPLRVEKTNTGAISVTVGPPPDLQSGNQTVLFEAELDQQNVYVQGQLILTLRVQQSINLDRRSISEFTLDDAFVKPLEQRSFQRTVAGRQWLVHEVRYAIFPEKSGTLQIPAQEFTGRVPEPRRSLFDRSRMGSLVRRKTEPLSINVLPRPDNFTASTWLPVRKLSLEETWSTPPDKLRVGESATRTITIKGEGAQGAQLPPIQFTPTNGLKFYPDQPQISEEEISSGLLGIRLDSAAMVPTQAGNFLIPEIRIPWWDVESEQIRYAVIPQRRITALPGELTLGQPIPAPISIDSATASSPANPYPQGNPLTWQILAAVSTLGWLLTLLYLWRRRDRPRENDDITGDRGESERKAFKRLLASCGSSDPEQTRGAIITWAASLQKDPPPVSLDQVAGIFSDDKLTGELKQLDTALYARGRGKWNGDTLAECLRKLRRSRQSAEKTRSHPISLYPSGS